MDGAGAVQRRGDVSRRGRRRRPGNDGLKAWAKFGGSTTEVHHPSTLLPLSIRYYYACYVGRHVMEYVVLPSVSYFYERVALRAPLVNGNL